MAASGCATAIVRSDSTVTSQHIFPATTIDAQFFWDIGLRGKPLFASADPNARCGPVAKLGYSVGAIADSPFSVAFDTLLLPVDLIRSRSQAKEPETESGVASRSQMICQETNRTSSATGRDH